MASVQIITAQNLDLQITQSIFDLLDAVWPPDEGTTRDVEQALNNWRQQKAVHFLIQANGERMMAHAQLFSREIITPSGPLNVGALAAVCVHPESRGHGWGADVVRAAFEFLPELGLEVSLFQTGVPEFYEKLGARRVHNRFFNGHNPENPFWEENQIVYPASYDWPAGDIDLNGPGY